MEHSNPCDWYLEACGAVHGFIVYCMSHESCHLSNVVLSDICHGLQDGLTTN